MLSDSLWAHSARITVHEPEAIVARLDFEVGQVLQVDRCEGERLLNRWNLKKFAIVTTVVGVSTK